MDILVERRTTAPPEAVAGIMFDPAHDPEWIGGARRVECLGTDAPGVGMRVRRHGGFLGRSFSWVTEVTGFVAHRRLDMRFVEGPMRGGVSYSITPDGAGGAVVAIRNHGSASFAIPGIGWFLRRSVGKDLDRLIALAEGRA